MSNREQEILEKRFKVVVCDESHFLKSRKTKRTQAAIPILLAAKRLVRFSPFFCYFFLNCSFLLLYDLFFVLCYFLFPFLLQILLTGTPALSRPVELHVQLSCLDPIFPK